MFCKVILPLPIKNRFIYKYPKRMILRKGDIVLVPFGKRKDELALVYDLIEKDELDINIQKIKEIIKVVNNLRLNTKILKFIKWVSDYTISPEGMILKMVILNKKIVDCKIKESQKTKHYENKKLVNLNTEQIEAFRLINKNLLHQQRTIVLEGVTGSGKTEVYFEAIEKILNLNLQVLILLPEISLTPQIEERFFQRFGIKPELWHSKISESKKRKTWHNCYSGFSKIIIGARSSLFLPFKNIGLIIVDEEHDVSYKQEEGVRYHARDMAIVRSKFEKIPIILSTATPSLETFYNVQKNKYTRVFLSKQYSGINLPNINLIDLKNEKLEKNTWISNKILEGISTCLKKKRQSLIFLNRRGYAPLTVCNNCGYRHQCNNCSSWLVMHSDKKILSCHHCGFILSISKKCPICKTNDSQRFIGPGVERVAEELQKEFPNAKLEIMSSDNMNTPLKIKRIIKQVELKKIDILIGTQILAKGYHFPNLSLVGILDADAGLMGGDLRASEHTYNLLQQVSGRAGRSTADGQVYIQTYFVKNQLIKSIQKRDRQSFLEQTLVERKKFNLPPFCYLVAIIISGPSKKESLNFAYSITNISKIEYNISILGPVEAPIFLLRGKYRYRLLLRGKKRKELNIFTNKLLYSLNIPKNMRLVVDVDPYSFI